MALPSNIKEQIENAADVYVKKLHPSEHTGTEAAAYIAGATQYATKAQEAEEKIQQLEQWKREASELLAPILDYGQGHREAQLGASCTEFVLNRAKKYDDLKAENNSLLVKLAKAMQVNDLYKVALGDIARQHKSNEWEEEGDTEHGYDCIIDVARKALSSWNEGKEGKKEDPRNNPLIGEDDSWIHDTDMGNR